MRGCDSAGVIEDGQPTLNSDWTREHPDAGAASGGIVCRSRSPSSTGTLKTNRPVPDLAPAQSGGET